MFSSQFYETLKNTNFVKHLQTAASDIRSELDILQNSQKIPVMQSF